VPPVLRHLAPGQTMPKNKLEAFSDGVIAILITIMSWRFP
jgi:uncharacterized membrane protein